VDVASVEGSGTDGSHTLERKMKDVCDNGGEVPLAHAILIPEE